MINSINCVIDSKHECNFQKNSHKKNDSQNTNEEVIVEIGAKPVENSIYSKPKLMPNSKQIEALKKQADDAYAPLKELVDKLLLEQAKRSRYLTVEELDIKPEDIEKAKQLISEDGDLGVNKTAERIVSFAKAISGGDKSKIGELRAAIDEGFRQASNLLGGLPDICRKTYDEVMKRLDEWEMDDPLSNIEDVS